MCVVCIDRFNWVTFSNIISLTIWLMIQCVCVCVSSVSNTNNSHGCCQLIVVSPLSVSVFPACSHDSKLAGRLVTSGDNLAITSVLFSSSTVIWELDKTRPQGLGWCQYWHHWLPSYRTEEWLPLHSTARLELEVNNPLRRARRQTEVERPTTPAN